jgi:hypothetical protein
MADDKPATKACCDRNGAAAPGDASGRKKHPCPDCSFCQWCSDDRCNLCLGKKGRGGRKLSIQEQIDLYESVNRTDTTDGND